MSSSSEDFTHKQENSKTDVFYCFDFSRFLSRISTVLDFIWGHKPPKIKDTTLIKTRQEGSLEMKDFSLFNKALKLNWVKRLCSNSDAPWQYISKSLLANVGGPELFKCNYDIDHLTGAPNENIVQKYLNMALLNVFQYLNGRYRHIFIP